MRLEDLSAGVGTLVDPSAADLDINYITHDSRKVQHGSIFVAIEGLNTDGHHYIGAAAQLGAVCVMTSQPDKVPCRMPVLQVDEPRRAMAQVARALFKYPDQALKVVGITGTNGKTTCTYLVNYLLRPLGQAGRIGTLSYFNGVSEETSSRTTPESSEMFRLLGEMVTNDCQYASVEISSHGLMFDRVLGLELQYGLFTNLSRDHLDFHGDMDSYFQAKTKQFDLLRKGGTAVINWDDPYGRKIQLRDDVNCIKIGTRDDVDLHFQLEDVNVKGCGFRVSDGESEVFVRIPLLGRHNVYNFVTAMAVAKCEGRSLQEMAGAHPDATPVPGRAEPLDLGQPFGVIIDFAHTPDALEKVLSACKETNPNRLIALFGAGGDRDTTKRKEMGQIADRYADILILTSDNPRNENPEAIMDMIQGGIKRPLGRTFFRNWDRKMALREALAMAKPGDLVLIAGKGHESTQEIQGKHHPFNDRLEASLIIRDLMQDYRHV